MESGGKGEEVGGFDVFRDGGLVELLGAAGFGGVGELLDMRDEDMEQKVRVAGGEAVGMDGLFLRCSPAYPLPCLSSPTSSSYRMLCFGGDEGFLRERNDGFPQKSGASGNDSSSTTSSSSSNSSLSKLKKEAAETRGCSDAADRGRASTTTATTARTPATAKAAAASNKKPRKEPAQQRPASQGRTLKVRKENLGDRISALQQLVSPFGKSDTASVLHEALGYIRFLHNQVQVLSSPYLQRLPTPAPFHADGGGGGEGAPRRDLRSRGLCLVPVACTAKVAGSNGADFWSPAMESGGVDDCHHPEVTEH